MTSNRLVALAADRRAGPVGGAVVALFLLTFPLYGSNFQIAQIVAYSMLLGIIAVSLVFLAGYGGMVSLAQASLYGLSAYVFGILTVNHAAPGLGVGPFVVVHGYSWWVGVIGALLAATLAALIFGVISVRSQGIYFLMITTALGMIVYNFALENYSIFNGHGGIGGEKAPTVAGVSFDPTTHPKAFYYLTFVIAAVVYAGLRYVIRSPFGLALQGVRDNPRRMRALGFWVEGHRVAAFTLAGFIAGVGGILYVWFFQNISPDAINLTQTINVLVIAVIGGLIYFEGAFVGALLFVLVNNFASSYNFLGVNWTERYNTLIGLTFLVIVLFSPNGLIGLPQVIMHLPRTISGLRSGASSRSREMGPERAEPAGRITTVDERTEGVDERSGVET